MKVAVMSCWAYRDAWFPFFSLVKKYCPDYNDLWLVTDRFEQAAIDQLPVKISVYEAGPRTTWCQQLSWFAKTCNEPFIMYLEDFFPTTPPVMPLIEHGVKLMSDRGAGCVRLYPCPGSDEEIGDEFYGGVSWKASYRISTMTAIWNPEFIQKIANRNSSPWEFELRGTEMTRSMQTPILAFKRDVKPWPVEYICTGITRGLWTPSAKQFLEREGIKADYTLRLTE